MVLIVIVEEFKCLFDVDEDVFVFDVWELYEWDIVYIEGVILILFGWFFYEIYCLDTVCDIVIHCWSGGCSVTVIKFFLEVGFGCVRNFVGGIFVWFDCIDLLLFKY